MGKSTWRRFKHRLIAVVSLVRALLEQTKLTHIAGSRVRDPDAVLRVVSEGGGTMLMKPYLDFETVRRDLA